MENIAGKVVLVTRTRSGEGAKTVRRYMRSKIAVGTCQLLGIAAGMAAPLGRAVDGKTVTWMEKVTDEQYNAR